MKRDVVVVGAGPAGCAAAALLAREGLRVILVDKSATPPAKACGEYISPGCLRILERIGALTRLRDLGARALHGMLVHTIGGRTLWATYPRGGKSGELPDHGLGIRRAFLDPILLDIAIEDGAEFQPHFQVCDLRWEEGGVEGVRGRHRGRKTTVPGRLIVGADGRHSVVARRLGSIQRHRWLDKFALVGYFARVRRGLRSARSFSGGEDAASSIRSLPI